MGYVISTIEIVLLVLCFIVGIGSCSVVGSCIWRWRNPTKRNKIEIPRHDFKPFETKRKEGLGDKRPD